MITNGFPMCYLDTQYLVLPCRFMPQLNSGLPHNGTYQSRTGSTYTKKIRTAHCMLIRTEHTHTTKKKIRAAQHILIGTEYT